MNEIFYVTIPVMTKNYNSSEAERIPIENEYYKSIVNRLNSFISVVSSIC